MNHRSSFAKLMNKQAAFTGGKLKLYGREEEEAILLEAYRRVCQDAQQELVLISGKPGTGKTALAQGLRPAVGRDKNFFIQGKFEEYATQEPYEAFVSALSQYTDRFLEAADTVTLERCRKAVKEAIGNDGVILTDLIPALERLLGKQEAVVNECYGSDAINRFRLDFSNFIRALTTVTPLVIFLDDIQWADTASMEIVRVLMHSRHMSLLLIASVRNEEASVATATPEQEPSSSFHDACSQIKPFKATLRDLEKENPHVRLSFIRLVDLNVEAVNILLSDLLKKKLDDTQVLANVVVSQTHGNIFHVLHFLRLLVDQGFLVQDHNEKWSWDNEKIQNRLGSEETIMDLVRQTLESMPHGVQEALKVASCMGNEIDDSALDLVLQTNTGKYLEQAAQEGLLVFHPQYGGYRFAHDWIRETALELIPEDERAEYYLKVGRRLWKSSGPSALDKNIIMIVCILNKGADRMEDERERNKIARLNLKAGKKAISLAAYPDASRFLRQGIQLLGYNRWIDQYELALSLYSTAAEVEVTNGNYDEAVKYIEEVVNRGRTLKDKLHAYRASLQAMAQQDDLKEATSVGLDVLRQLGEPLAAKPSKWALTRELIRVRMALRGKSNQELLNLPPMCNESKIASVGFLNLLFIVTYEMRSPYSVLSAFRSVLLTIKYGLHKESGTAFAAYGVILCGLGLDAKAGDRFGQLALSMTELTHRNQANPMVHFLNGAGIMHWTRSIKDSNLPELWYACRAGMELGQVELALMARSTHCLGLVFTGKNIQEVKFEVLETLRLTRLHRQHKTEILTSMLLQFLHCYEGRAKNSARLSGSAMSFEEMAKKCIETNNKTWLAGLYFYAMDVAYMFGDYDHAARMAHENRDVSKAPSAHIMFPELRCKEALVTFALARQGRTKPKSLRLAKKKVRLFKKWAERSPRSYSQKAKLLEAELASLKVVANPEVVYGLYDEAIALAAKEGFTNDAAVACERAGDFRDSCGDTEGAISMWKRAVDLYNKWGVKAKGKALSDHMSHQERSSN